MPSIASEAAAPRSRIKCRLTRCTFRIELSACPAFRDAAKNTRQPSACGLYQERRLSIPWRGPAQRPPSSPRRPQGICAASPACHRPERHSHSTRSARPRRQERDMAPPIIAPIDPRKTVSSGIPMPKTLSTQSSASTTVAATTTARIAGTSINTPMRTPMPIAVSGFAFAPFPQTSRRSEGPMALLRSVLLV